MSTDADKVNRLNRLYSDWRSSVALGSDRSFGEYMLAHQVDVDLTASSKYPAGITGTARVHGLPGRRVMRMADHITSINGRNWATPDYVYGNLWHHSSNIEEFVPDVILTPASLQDLVNRVAGPPPYDYAENPHYTAVREWARHEGLEL